MIISWITAVVASLAFPALVIAYRRFLRYKRVEIFNTFSSAKILLRYAKVHTTLRAQSREKLDYDELKSGIDEMFKCFYHWSSYVLPTIINMIFSFAAVMLGLSIAGRGSAFKTGLEEYSGYISLPFMLGMIGGLIWGVFEMLNRFRGMDLTPENMHYIWLRMAVSAIIAALIAPGLAPSVANIAAFAIGVLPINDLKTFLEKQANKHLSDPRAVSPYEPYKLHFIQGMSEQMVKRLGDLDIVTPQQLAYADPVKILLRTSIEWSVILDLIDQAILYNYIEERIVGVRGIGIRGAVELAIIHEDLSRRPGKAMDMALEKIKYLAHALGRDECGIYHLAEMLYEDHQVDLIWSLWSVKNDQ